MNVTTALSTILPIMVGAFVSALVEYLRTKHGFQDGELTVLSVAISLILGSSYVFLVHVGWLDTVIKVLAAACTFYAIIIKNLRPNVNS